jgi:TDG/mug DNA glycosylase family protein
MVSPTLRSCVIVAAVRQTEVRKRYAIAWRREGGKARLESGNYERESVDDWTHRYLGDQRDFHLRPSLVDSRKIAKNRDRGILPPTTGDDRTLTVPLIKSSFPPISSPAATVLILGSVPGERSLREGQYYAHPQNAFWKVMGQIIDLDPLAAYADRVLQLKEAGISLWDVIRSCERPGSLDRDILNSSIESNDFASFFRDHPQIDLVCFNGATAAQSFQHHVLPTLGSLELKYLRLPSTSPAHTISFANKVDAWTAISRHRQERKR